MQQTVVAIKAKEKRPYHLCARRITKTADHAIDRADLLDLHHRGALPGGVNFVETFRDDAVEVAANFFEPCLRLAQIGCCRGKTNLLVVREKLCGKRFERGTAFLQRNCN